jgi:hypothetical protein
MIKGVTENRKGYNILKSNCGSISKNFSNTVGNIETLIAELNKLEGSGTQTDLINVE